MATRLLNTQRIVNLSSNPASATAGEIYYNTSDNKLKFYNGTSWTDFGSGSGTVTSVGVSVPTGLSVANSPVTTSGTIAISLASGYTIPTTTALDAKAPLISPTLTTPNIGVATGTSFNSITGLSSTAPVVDGTASVGTGTTVARADHVHPTDTSRAALSSPTFTGTPASTTAAANTNTTQIATTAFVLGQAGASTPIVNGTAAAGTSLRYSRQDHVHGTDTTRAPVNSPTFTGTVTVPTPTNATDAATKAYVDNVAEGLHVHASVSTATTANIANLASPGASIDGVTLTTNMRVLVKNQTTTSQNGIYVFNGTGLVRASDFDTAAEIDGGDFVFVSGGTVNNDTGWVQTETVVTIGTSPIIFTQFSGAGTYTAGTGLSLTGTVFANTGVLSVNGSTGAVTGIATLASPALTGTPTVPTAAADTNTTQAASTAFVLGQASGSNPLALGSVAQGTSLRYSRQDHVHPTTGLGLTSGTLAQFAATTSSQLAGVISDETGSGALVFATSPTLTTPNIGVATGTSFNSITGLSSTNPVMDGTVAVGTGTTVARADHVHPVDTSRAPIASPTFTGTVTVPTLSLSTADTATASSHYIVETASDGIIRPKTLANVQTEVVTNTIMQSNIISPTAAGSNGIRKTTMSTSAPTGGNDGDVWLVHT